MKRILIPILLVFFISGISCQLNAQKDKKKEKTVTIKIEKETDDGKTVIDTTFTLKEGEDLHKVLEKYGIKADIHENHTKTFDINVETDDSLSKGDGKKMVWVSVDTDDGGHKDKLKHKQKKIVYVGDNDEDVEIIKIRKGDASDLKEIHENIDIEELEGDSLKIIKKIIITDSKGKKIKKHKKVYEFNTDSTEHGDHMIFITEGDDEDHDVYIKKLDSDNDSIEVIIKKMKKGKKGKHVYLTTDDNFTWTIDEDVQLESKDSKLSKIKIEIVDPTEEDLKILKLKKEYNKLDISDFYIFLNKDKDKMELKFTLPEKGNLSVKIFDATGKEIFKDDKKQFEGKYKNETKALKGTFIIQINQGKNYFIRRMMLDWK